MKSKVFKPFSYATTTCEILINFVVSCKKNGFASLLPTRQNSFPRRIGNLGYTDHDSSKFSFDEYQCWCINTIRALAISLELYAQVYLVVMSTFSIYLYLV